VDDAMEDHRGLYDCCERRDGAGAGELLRRHLDRTESAVREAFTPTGETEAGD
jgi:DNA-binding GntR family transcriptional regulator